jgi:hypothetical protein
MASASATPKFTVQKRGDRGLGQRILIDGEAGDGGAAMRGVAELFSLERVDGENVTVRLARRRAGTAIGLVAEVRLQMMRAGRQIFRRRVAGAPLQTPNVGRNIDDEPVPEAGAAVGASGSCTATVKFLPGGGHRALSSGETFSPVQLSWIIDMLHIDRLAFGDVGASELESVAPLDRRRPAR